LILIFSQKYLKTEYKSVFDICALWSHLILAQQTHIGSVCRVTGIILSLYSNVTVLASYAVWLLMVS